VLVIELETIPSLLVEVGIAAEVEATESLVCGAVTSTCRPQDSTTRLSQQGSDYYVNFFTNLCVS